MIHDVIMPVRLEHGTVIIEILVVGLVAVGGLEDRQKFRKEIDQHVGEYGNFAHPRKAA